MSLLTFVLVASEFMPVSLLSRIARELGISEGQAGQAIATPPSVKHWHRATAANAMSHIAITNVADRENVEWMEHVSPMNNTPPSKAMPPSPL